VAVAVLLDTAARRESCTAILPAPTNDGFQMSRAKLAEVGSTVVNLGADGARKAFQ
jgi:hypothetical protein